MAVNTEAIGKTYEPVAYAVGREKIREYASAVGETNPLHHDLEAARAAGYSDLVAPPMFTVPTWICQVRWGNFSIAIMQLTDTIEMPSTSAWPVAGSSG